MLLKFLINILSQIADLWLVVLLAGLRESRVSDKTAEDWQVIHTLG